jgi:hypothetical protein
VWPHLDDFLRLHITSKVYPSSLSPAESHLFSPLIYLRVLPRFLLIPSIALSHIFWIFYSFLSLQSLYTCLARVCVAVCIRKLFIGRTHDLMPRTHGHLIFLYASIDCVKAMSARSVSSSRATCFPFFFSFSFVSFFRPGMYKRRSYFTCVSIPPLREVDWIRSAFCPAGAFCCLPCPFRQNRERRVTRRKSSN